LDNLGLRASLSALNQKYRGILISSTQIDTYLSFVSGLINLSLLELVSKKPMLMTQLFVFPVVSIEKGKYIVGEDHVYIILFSRKGYAVSIFGGDKFETIVFKKVNCDSLRWSKVAQKEKEEYGSGYTIVDYVQVSGLLGGNFVFKIDDHPEGITFFNNLFFTVGT